MWDTNTVPVGSSHACAPTGTTVIVDSAQTAAFVTFGGVLQIDDPGSLTLVTGDRSTVNDLKITGGTYSSSGVMDAGGLQWSGGTIKGIGVVSVTSAVASNVTGSVSLIDESMVWFFGSVTWSVGNINVCNDATLVVAGGGTMQATNAGGAITTAGCASVGSAQVAVLEGGTWNQTSNATILIPFTNQGQTNIPTGATLSAYTYTQSGGTAATTTINSGATLALAGAGTLSLTAGTLMGSGTVNGSVSGAGAITPGSETTAASLSISGNYTASAGALVHAELIGSSGDSLLVAGTASLAGAQIQVAAPGAPPTSGTYPIVQAGTVVGTFDSATFPVSPGLVFANAYSPTQYTVTVSPDIGPDCPALLSGSSIPGGDAHNCDLGFLQNVSGLNLAGANMSGSHGFLPNFSFADLSGTNFTGASYFAADFTNSIITGTNFSGSSIDGFSFDPGDFTDMTNAHGTPASTGFINYTVCPDRTLSAPDPIGSNNCDLHYVL